MSATQIPSKQKQSDILRCKRCNTVLPLSATFCSKCGERIVIYQDSALPKGKTAIADMYRITSLVRRSAYIQTFRALDIRQHFSVIINDIALGGLDEEARTQIIAALQQEYDLLRNQSIPGIIPFSDFQVSQEHLSTVARWPVVASDGTQAASSTLQELLQSGIGLPDEQTALAWVEDLSHSLAHLHAKQVIFGDLDPRLVFVSDNSYSGQPALLVANPPQPIRHLLPQASNNIDASAFIAPEVSSGQIDSCSDIYSLGALLYLLLTGVVPADPASREHDPLSSPRELNAHIQNGTDALVMRALSLKSTERFQSADELSESLSCLRSDANGKRSSQRLTAKLPKQVSKSKKALEEKDTASTPSDNKNGDRQETASTGESGDVAVAVVPLQAQMARRYLSRMKTEHLETQAQHGEETLIGDKSLPKKPLEKVSVEKSMPGEQPVQAADPVQPSAQQKAPGPTDAPAGGVPLSEEPPVRKPDQGEVFEDKVTDLSAQETQRLDLMAIAAQETVLLDTSALTSAIRDKKEASAAENTQQTTVQDERRLEQSVPPTEPTARSTALVPVKSSSLLPVKSPSLLPARSLGPAGKTFTRLKSLLTGSLVSVPRQQHASGVIVSGSAAPEIVDTEAEAALLKRMQRFILGEQQHATAAAAIIETPLRIQPNQSYSIRINVTGRSARQGGAAGLSCMVEGDVVHIEVRSALYENYAYIIQQTDVQIPTAGYTAEITMPMQSLATGSSGHRERLHIFFMDVVRSPLYEKPFVIELFISPLVHAGREGRNVLPIPL